MASRYTSDIAFTPAVKRLQVAKGSRHGYAAMESGRGWKTTITPDLEAYLAGLDMFYLATANVDGQPYVQHRGGRPGFLRVIDERTLAFADFAGNRQYITIGNLSENHRAFLFLINYATQQRVKIWGTARVVEDDPTLLSRLADADYPAGRPERAIVFHVEAWDINCPQHIHRRYSHEQLELITGTLRSRVAELEAEVDRLRQND